MQFDPAWFLLGLGKVYLLALGVLAAVGAVVAGILKLWRERPGTDRDPLSR
jgi:hypothetical protein